MLITYPVTYTPENSDTYAIRAAVPIRYACPDLPPGFLLNETDGWNCNLCGSDVAFFAPYEPGDIIPFQTRFGDNYNMPASVLTYGIKTTTSGADNFMIIELQDCCGVTISDEADEFCSVWWVANSVQTGSVQTWFVNTGLFPTDLKCFRLKITYYKINQSTLLPEIERTIYTEYYKEVNECGEDTVLIESTYQSADCNGLYYGTPTNYNGNANTAYYNSMRVHGLVQWVGDSVSNTENDKGTIIKTEKTDFYQIVSGIYPPYFMRRLQQALRGNAVFADGVQYQNWTFSNLEPGFKTFALTVEMENKCFIDNRKCNF